ncbi:ABC transporter permease [Cognataquiflexum aquatile]|uniref:ABC transporter permease n=1 Tax=Cognataquiflexum aquatile TaxID=2249427 RepID=UPI000DEA27AB|nr:ABC transporter permease [Cognataquiflexum aquatile]
MIKNYFITAWRNIKRQKSFSVINIFGLAIGLACCLILLAFVRQELSYDHFHTNSDRIFRVAQKVEGNQNWAWTGGAVAPMMVKEFDQVESAVRIHRTSTYLRPADGPNQGESFREEKFTFADEGFFEVFDFPLLSGTTTGVLDDPFQILLTESMAKKYFGKEDPIGKSLISTGDFEFVVKGVLKDLPSNTHLDFDFITSLNSFKATESYPLTAEFGSFWWPYCYTYVKLKDPSDVHFVNSGTLEASKKARSEEEAKKYIPFLQPITDIHLDNSYQSELSPSTPKSTVYIFLSIGIFILILACINFINLSTARAIKRMKEIGIRKVTGAKKSQLVLQFFTESFLVNVFAMVLALVLVEILLPVFSGLLQQEIPFNLFADRQVWMFLLITLAVSTFLSGFFPALYLSGLKPNLILKGTTFQSNKSALRQSLVVLQFVMSGILVFCATVAYFQQSYMRKADLGFDRENIIAISMGEVSRSNRESLTNAYKQFSFVENVLGSSARPGVDAGWGPQISYEGQNPNDQNWINQQYVDFNYFETIGVEMVAGREFSSEFNDKGDAFKMREIFPAIRNGGFIINESLAKMMGLSPEQTLGKPIEVFTEENGERFMDFRGNVVGVVKDYQTSDLRFAIQPTIYAPVQNGISDNSSHLLVKINSEDIPQATAALSSKWKEINPSIPFEYSLLEDSLVRQYDRETRLSNLLGLFALLTLLISSLGLLGLSIFMAEGRRKEIGIRKVMGASPLSIVHQLTKDFLKPVIVAIVLALPIGYYIMGTWLEQFANKVQMQVGFFVLTAAVAILIAWLTIAIQSWRAASDNPADSLKAE